MEGEANPVAGENRDEDPWIILLHRQAHRLEQGPPAIYAERARLPVLRFIRGGR